MLHRVERFCREHGLFHPGDGVIVACSGGVDSLALAQLLSDWRKTWGLRLCIAHFEHGIRGEESLEDARFVQEWCEERRLLFRMESADVPLVARQKGVSLETAARELRYAFLERLRRELSHDVIATAHHGDDQAETVLMHLLRGSGIDGLAGMLPRSGRIVRPFLSVRKQELEAFCRAKGLQPRHDATNDRMDCTRNRLRLDLLPKLQREYHPGIAESLCQLAVLAAEQRDYMAGEAARVFPSVLRRKKGLELSQKAFCLEPPALQRVLLRGFLKEAGMDGKDLSFRHFDALRELLLHGMTGNRTELPRNWTAELSYGWLRLRRGTPEGEERALQEQVIAVPGDTFLVGYGFRMVAQILREKPEGTGPEEYYCDYDRLVLPLRIRPRHTGDRMLLSVGRKSLKKLMIDSRIPREERGRMPVLVSGEDVLWVPGLRRSSLFSVSADTKRVLYLKITKEEVRDHDER